ncbi:hypothetical protein QI294_11990 [Staphylococcus saprophyticus]|uniref:TcaA NTF2-like domain-containing protein n=1 Tax=Staphylococcus sp. GFQ9D221P TaxID=2804440 RepID=UPI0019513E38|nr:hypothetical protein [Staphylococcus sp. GFQ9D221P]MDW4003474.1 hypothetical protein [Staphylococcus saprophyticus]
MSNDEENLNRTDDNQEDKSKKKKTIIIVGVLVVVLILLGLIIYYFVNQKDANGQIDDFKAAVEDRNYSEISKLLSTNSQKISKTDAKHFVDYINTDNNKRNFEQDIEQTKENLDKGQHDSEIGEIKDKNDRPFIKIVKNGKQFFFIDKIDFEPQMYDVYVKEGNNTASYRFQNNNNKEQQVIANKNKTTKLGSFFVGDYRIDATKDFEEDESIIEGSVDGSLDINTDDLGNNKRIIAKDDFEQAWFKVNLKNTEKLDKVKKIYIDDKEADYKKGEIYGKFPAESPIKVHAIGNIEDDEVKTKPVEVEANTNNKSQSIDLIFNQKTIDDHIKKNKKIEDKAKSYMSDYTEDLNKAYKTSSFRYVKKYFEKDSELANHIKGQVESKKKSKYSDLNISKSKKDGNQVELILSKKNEDKVKIQSRYILKYDKDKDDFIIKEYTDI